MPPEPGNNPEIENALKEFEARASVLQKKDPLKTTPDDVVIPDMAQFEDKPSKMVGWLMRVGGFGEQRQAEYILLIFSILTLTLSAFLIFGIPNFSKEPTRVRDIQNELPGKRNLPH